MMAWVSRPFAVVYGGPRLPQYSPKVIADCQDAQLFAGIPVPSVGEWRPFTIPWDLREGDYR